jgi:MtN3 and saliva related transmembrane protein
MDNKVMDLTTLEILGLIAGTITSVGFLPQIIKGYKTKKLEDVSNYMPIILAIGMTLWMIYGLLMNAIAVIVANIIGVSCNLIIIIMKKIYS